ncbi:MAG: hypothetical protein HZB42_00730 [Sphingobacteriales bacterium]|nr:hypothetical protein [Sphingobacteriales bacterium]
MKIKHLILIALSVVLLHTQNNAQDTNWVKKNTWYFDNFVRDTLPWSIFRENYIGVAPAPAADFDQLFYTYLFRTELAGKGHCYGMDVMELLMMKNGGHLGYCHPPYIYTGCYDNCSPGTVDSIGPTDLTLRTALEMVHGFQINHGFLSYLLDIIAINKQLDGRYAYQQVNYHMAKSDFPIMSISKGLSPTDGAHVVVPYFTEDLGATKKIYVYDPNRSFYKPGSDGKEWYKSRNNFIEINSASGAWKFSWCCDGTFWPSNPGIGGNILCIPLSVAGRKDRLPQSLLADGAYAINTIFIWGNVKVNQISDFTAVKKYLNEDGTNIEPSEEKRLNNIIPFIPMDGGLPSKGTGKTNAYFFRGSEPVRLSYKAYGEYKIGMIFNGKYYEIKGTGKGELQNFSADEKLLNNSVKSTGSAN